MNCNVLSVKAPNGEPSRLYEGLLRRTGSPQEALRLYLGARRLIAPGTPVDQNGEPRADYVLASFGGDVVFDPRPGTSKLPEELAHALSQIDLTISDIEKRYRADLPRERRAFYERRISELTEQRERILNQANLFGLEQVAKEQIEWARKISEQSQVSIEDLMIALRYARSWHFDVTRAWLTELDTSSETYRLLQKISVEAQRVQDQIDEALRRIMLEDIYRYRPTDEQITPDRLKEMMDVGMGQTYTLDTSTVDNAVVQHLDTVLKNANRNQTGALRRIVSRLVAFSKEVDSQRLLQRDASGKPTGRLITPFSHKYYAKREEIYGRLSGALSRARDIVDEQKREKARRDAFKRYYKDLAEVEVHIDPRFFVVEGFSTTEFTGQAEYVRYLERQFGKEQAARFIQEAKDLYERFQEELKAKERELVMETVTGVAQYQIRSDGTVETHEQYVKRHLDAWKNEHDPTLFMEEQAGAPKQYLARHGRDFIKSVPRRYSVTGKETGFYDKAYEALSEKEREFLEYVSDVMYQMKNMLPSHVQRRLHDGFLPVIQKDLVETLSEDGMTAALGYMDKAFVDAITKPETISLLARPQQDVLDPVTGFALRRIPVMFTEANLPVEDRSLDLPRIVAMFSAMAINYHFKTEVEDVVRAAQRVVHQARDAEKGVGAPENLKRLVDYTIDASVYGKKRVEGKSKTRLYRGKNPLAKRRKARELERQARELNEKRDHDEITEEEYEEELRKLEDEYQALGGKEVDWHRVGDQILKFTYLKALGLNLPASIANISFGILANMVHASQRQEFTGREFAAAFRIMMMSPPGSAPLRKAAAVAKVFDVMFETNETRYDLPKDVSHETKRGLRKLGMNSFYYLQQRSEFRVQGLTMVAMMLRHKVRDKEGNERSLWEAYNVDGSWNVDEFGEQPEWNDVLQADERNEFTRFRDRLLQTNKLLHGNYDPNSPILIKSHVLGRALMMFRSWIPFTVMNRFRSAYYDAQLGRTVKGRYVTYGDILQQEGLRGLTSIFFRTLAKTFSAEGVQDDRFDPVDLANMRANVNEVILMSGMFIALLMLYSALDDDDEETMTGHVMRILVGTFTRVQADLLFYVNPETTQDILKNIIPAARTYEDFMGAVRGTYGYLFDEEYRGQHPGWKWARNFPVTSQIYKVWYMANHTLK